MCSSSSNLPDLIWEYTDSQWSLDKVPFVLSSATTLLSSVLYLPSLCLSCLGSEGTLTRAQGSVSVSCVHVHCVHPFPFPCPLPLLIPSLSARCVSSQALLASLQSAIPSVLVGKRTGLSLVALSGLRQSGTQRICAAGLMCHISASGSQTDLV